METETPARLLEKFVRGLKISDFSEEYDRTDLDHEIFSIHDLRYHVPIKVLLSTSEGSTRSISPRHVAREPVEKAIFAATGTTGCLRGNMVRQPRFIKMEGSETFQEMWAVKLDMDTVSPYITPQWNSD